MGKGDRKPSRWATTRQEKKKAREERKAAQKGAARKGKK